MSKMTIIEGNSNDKDNVRAYMVKGEPGVSPTIGVSKEDGVTTLTIEDAEGTHTATIADGDDLVGGVPTDGVIGFDGEATDIPDGYEVLDDINLVKSFNTIAEMKAAETLQAGDTCQLITNNGDVELYKIVDDNALIADDYYIIELDNGLFGIKVEQNIVKDNDIKVQNRLELNRIMRLFYKNSKDPTWDSSSDFAGMQGGTYTGDNKMVIARIRDNSTKEVILQEISLNTGATLRENNTLILNHANSITYNPTTKKLYIASLMLNTSTGINHLHEIYVIDYDSFTLENTITLNDLPNTTGIHSISYDIEWNKYYIALEDGTLNNAISIYELNIDTHEIKYIDLEDVTGLMSKTNTNDILVYDNILYILKFRPMTLLCYDLHTKEFKAIYNIDNVTNLGNSVGELENISIKYDTTIKNIILGSSRPECVNGYYNMHQYFECNPVYGVCNQTPQNNNVYSPALYVDINSTAINPDGTNSNKFKHLSEALEVTQILSGYIFIYIADGTYPYVYFRGGKNTIVFQGNINNKLAITIQGMYLEYSNSNIYLNNLKIARNNSNTYDLEIDLCSRVRLASVVFTDNNITNHIRLRRSVLEFLGLDWNNKLLKCESNAIAHCLDEIPQYNFTGQKPSFYKEIKLFENVKFTSKETKTLTIPDKLKGILDFNGVIDIDLHGYYNYSKTSYVYSNNKNIRNVACWLGPYYFNLQMKYADENTFTITLLEAKCLSANNEKIWADLTDINFDITIYYL